MVNYPSYISQHVRMDNFAGQLSGKITTSGTSASFTFSPLTGSQTTTFQVVNKGTKGAYLAFGVGSATATASLSTGNGTATSVYLAAGAIHTYDCPNKGNGPIDTIAAIQGGDTQDNGATIIEISVGYGQ